MAEVEGELSEDPQLALDEDPAWRGRETGRTVPGLERGRGGGSLMILTVTED